MVKTSNNKRRLPISDARHAALAVLLSVQQRGQKLDDALAQTLPLLEAHRERAFAQHLAYSVLRWHLALLAIYRQLVRKPLADKDLDIELIILLGLEQLWHAHTPAHAAINTSVELVRHRKKPWAKGLVNAVLRRFQREQNKRVESLDNTSSTRYSCPPWLLQAWQEDWPENWQEIAISNLEEPPFWLRSNLRKHQRAEFTTMLKNAGIESTVPKHPETPAAVFLPHAVPVTAIPEFMQGSASVQDISTQMAAVLLDPQPGDRILDACAAPGGKTAQLLEQYPDIHLTALDNKPLRLEKLITNLQRLGLSCETHCADAADPDSWWNKQHFDRILLDAPCSASGIIRRHPDIKHHLSPDAIADLQAQQRQLLKSLWQTLRPGGMLTYVTCSILSAENQTIVEEFCSITSDAKAHDFAAADSTQLPIGRPVSSGWQILPGDNIPTEAGQFISGDGLFFACLQKTC